MRKLSLLILSLLCLNGFPVQAHASLARSDPPPNAVLEQSPAEIRLWFTEPLESDFSQITLRDVQGDTVQTPESLVDPADDFQLVLPLESLPHGVYTVSWRVVSSADGHLTQGSFPIIIGDAAALQAFVSGEEARIPAASSIIRWLNLLAIAAAVGGVGFWLFVWQPASITDFRKRDFSTQLHPPAPSPMPREGEQNGWQQLLKSPLHLLERGFRGEVSQSAAEHHLTRLIGWSWLALGVASVLILLLQTSIVTGEVVTLAAVQRVIMQTRFGQLWVLRVLYWLGFGVAIYLARRDWRVYWLATAFGLAILHTHSLFSHASSDGAASTGADWLHMLAMALWIGGLLQFVNVLRVVRGDVPLVSQLTAYFSNMARVAVVILIITGLYASWLQVGSLEGLRTTVYGQALLLKLLLFVPVMALAGFNLFFTSRGLHAGQVVWSGRLRVLVTAEILLTVAVLAAVGVMTAISPARSTLAARASIPPPPEPYVETQITDDLQIGLTVAPGQVGSNTFTVTLQDADGTPINDVSRIRLRFESLGQSLGESELRPEFQQDGTYSVSGSNLSVPGVWRIRATIQRPGFYDTVVDFAPDIQAPVFAVMQPVETAPSNTARSVALTLTGLVGLVAGVLFLISARRTFPLTPNPSPAEYGGEGLMSPRSNRSPLAGTLPSPAFGGRAGDGGNWVKPLTNAKRSPSSSTGRGFGGGVIPSPPAFLAIILTLVSAGFLLIGFPSLKLDTDAPVQASIALAADAPMQLAISGAVEMPYLRMADGTLRIPGTDGMWQTLDAPALLRDIYLDGQAKLWAGGDSGVYTYQDGEWTQQDSTPAERLISTHGYLFALGTGEIWRGTEGGALEVDSRILDVPQPENVAQDFVMLGNHTHVLLNGGAVYVTDSVGLGWQPLDAPAPIHSIGTDVNGNLLASTDEALLLWNWNSALWRVFAPLPDEQHPIHDTIIFQDRLYVTAGGRLYEYQGSRWNQIEPNGARYLTDLAVRYPHSLWALDSNAWQIYVTEDGEQWTDIPIRTSDFP